MCQPVALAEATLIVPPHIRRTFAGIAVCAGMTEEPTSCISCINMSNLNDRVRFEPLTSSRSLDICQGIIDGVCCFIERTRFYTHLDKKPDTWYYLDGFSFKTEAEAKAFSAQYKAHGGPDDMEPAPNPYGDDWELSSKSLEAIVYCWDNFRVK